MLWSDFKELIVLESGTAESAAVAAASVAQDFRTLALFGDGRNFP
jgi:hypothetical protein